MPAATGIITAYGDEIFASRTEARWAAFFDALHISWLYEPWTVNIEMPGYTPDFFLSTLQTWVEIKGEPPSIRQIEKLRRLAVVTELPAYLLWGVCAPSRGEAESGAIYASPTGEWWGAYGWRECTGCGLVRPDHLRCPGDCESRTRESPMSLRGAYVQAVTASLGEVCHWYPPRTKSNWITLWYGPPENKRPARTGPAPWKGSRSAGRRFPPFGPRTQINEWRLYEHFAGWTDGISA